MSKWDWLEKPDVPATWLFMIRISVKAALLFALVNMVFAVLSPMDALGRLSLYNLLVPGRERLPYGENADLSYNLSTFNVPAMFASHTLTTGKADDEFRVLLFGDSATWGWFLDHDQTITAHINAGEFTTADGRRVVAYNLGYPIMSLTKDLMLMDYAMRYDPDLIVWAFTLESFPQEKQLFPPLVQNNADRVRGLIEQYDLRSSVDDARFVERDFINQTIVGQRRELAEIVRLQTLGFSWAATGIDQFIPDEYTAASIDQSDNITWEGIDQPRNLTPDDLAFDVLAAGISLAGDVPVLLVNEPMLISDGENSDVRYNAFFPRWAYDSYHELLLTTAEANDWQLLDLWDLLPNEAFTDSPVHTTAAGANRVAEAIAGYIVD